MKKLSVFALIAGVAAWVMTRGKKHEMESEHDAAPVMAGATPDTGPSEG